MTLTLNIAKTGLTDSILQTALFNNTLALGAHVISITDCDNNEGQSDSFISRMPPSTQGAVVPNVPEPGSLALMGAGMLGLFKARRRTTKRC